MGVDMSRVEIKVNEATKTITIAVPDAEIFYHDVDEESFEVLDEKNNIFNPISAVDVNEFNKKYEQQVFKKIEERRLLEDAYNNAMATIKNILIAVPEIADQYTIGYKIIEK